MNTVPCRGCRRQIDPESAFCPACGVVANTFKPNPVPRDRKGGGSVLGKVAGIVGVVLLLAIGAALATMKAVQDAKEARPIAAAEFKPDPNWTPAIGDEAEVHTGSRPGGTYLCSDAASYGAMLEAVRAGDNDLVGGMIRGGKIHRAANGTPVKVLNTESNPLVAKGVAYLKVSLTNEAGGRVSGLMPRGHVARNRAAD